MESGGEERKCRKKETKKTISVFASVQCTAIP
jgi:hypothetical protein